MATKKRALTPLQRRFVLEYCIDFNARRAYERAGGSERGSETHGPATLRKPHVRALVEAELKHRETEIKLRAARVVEDTYRQATVDIGQLFKDGKLLDVEEIPEEARRAVASIEVEKRIEGQGEDAEVFYVHKIKLHDKRASQELFLKYAGKLKDVVQHEGLNLEQLVLAADKQLRETKAAEK